jgi:glutamate 5-kinase
MISNRKLSFDSAKRVVVKIGSNVLTENNGLNVTFIRSITRQICRLIDDGREVILVSSGAMASGVKKVGLTKRPDELPQRQAVAAVGQAGLIMAYEKAFGRHHKKVAQILEEIKFGDNDNLAAMITLLMDADILINLTDIEGLFDKDPRIHQDAQLIPMVTTITKNTEQYASEIAGALGTGGMISKIRAARKVNSAGIPMVIAKGDSTGILTKIFSDKARGTFFVPKKERLTSRKCWIAFSLKPHGAIKIDDGAAEAILNNGKSLLSSGIIAVEADFKIGAPVEFRNRKNEILGIGLANYSADDIRKIMGLKSNQIKAVLGHKSYDEVIHRDNLVITCDGMV